MSVAEGEATYSGRPVSWGPKSMKGVYCMGLYLAKETSFKRRRFGPIPQIPW